MPAFRSADTRWAVHAAAGLLLVAKIVYVGVRPLRELAMSPFLIDDAFITLSVARNLADGRGFTFDGVSLTAGSSHLWTTLAGIVFAVIPADDTAAKACMVLSAAFAGLASVVLFHIGARIFGAAAGVLAFALANVLLSFTQVSMNALDTSLFLLLALLLGCVFVTRGVNRNRSILCGILAGFAIATRADGVFLAAAILLMWLGTIVKERRLEDLKSVAIFCLVVAMCVAPSVALNLAANGSLAPANQAGRRFIAWEGWGGTITPAVYAAKSAANFILLYKIGTCTIGLFWLFGSLLIAACFQRDPLKRKWSRLTATYASSFLLMLALYQWYFPDVHGIRYMVTPVMMMLPPACGYAADLLRAVGGRSLGVVLAAGFVALVGHQSFANYTNMVGRLAWARHYALFGGASGIAPEALWAPYDWAATEVPKGVPIAAKDHGKLAFFARVRIVDLAGVIDPAVIPSIRGGTLIDYVHGKGAGFIVLYHRDWYYLNEAARSSREGCRLELAASFAPVHDNFDFYKVVCPIPDGAGQHIRRVS